MSTHRQTQRMNTVKPSQIYGHFYNVKNLTLILIKGKGLHYVGCRDKRHCMVNLKNVDNAVGQYNAA